MSALPTRNEKGPPKRAFEIPWGVRIPDGYGLCHKLILGVKHYLHQHNTPSFASSFKSLTRASRIRTSRSSRSNGSRGLTHTA
jgi:hypothetical protein